MLKQGLFGRREHFYQTGANAPKLSVTGALERDTKLDIEHAHVSLTIRKSHERFLPADVEPRKTQIPSADLLLVKVSWSHRGICPQSQSAPALVLPLALLDGIQLAKGDSKTQTGSATQHAERDRLPCFHSARSWWFDRTVGVRCWTAPQRPSTLTLLRMTQGESSRLSPSSTTSITRGSLPLRLRSALCWRTTWSGRAGTVTLQYAVRS